MDSLKELIIKITEFPELYIGKPSVELLYAFLGGFLYQNDSADDHCLDGFNEFVLQKYRLRTDHNWANVIQFFSNTEQEAFDKFTQLFKEFSQGGGQNMFEQQKDSPIPLFKTGRP